MKMSDFILQPSTAAILIYDCVGVGVDVDVDVDVAVIVLSSIIVVVVVGVVVQIFPCSLNMHIVLSLHLLCALCVD